MHARATFSESGPVFSSSNFGIKKTHSLARTVVVGRLFTMIDITASFWNTLLLRGALRLSRMRFVSFLKRFFSRVASRKLITVVFFFFSLSFFPNFTKRHTTHFARAKAKDGRRKRPTTKVSYSHSLMIKRNNNGDKNNENARSSALPYLVVCTKKSCFKFMCTFSREKHVGPSFGNTKTNEFYDLGLQTLLLKTEFFSSSWKKEQQKKEAKNGRKQRN